MQPEEISRQKAEVVRQYGEWTAHNIHLGGGVYTYDESHPEFQSRVVGYTKLLRRILQASADLTGRPLSELRVLDLACLEGQYAVEFALHGAEVVGVEVREANIEKSRFAGRALGLDRLTFELDDVRNLSAERYGQFDVVLCIGILYHLDAPDVFDFIERIAEVTSRVAIFDTHVSLRPNRTHNFRGRDYRGWSFAEHRAGATDEEKLQQLWASLDNNNSFWFSRPSLYNLLAEVGFTSVYDCQVPAFPGQLTDRDTIAAVKGRPVLDVRTLPTSADVPRVDWTEQHRVGLEPTQQSYIAAQDRGLVERALGRAKRLFK